MAIPIKNWYCQGWY